MNWASWAGIGLVGVAAVALALASPNEPPISGEVNAQEQTQTQTEAPNTVEEPQPKRHKITVNLTSPNDLKVKEGQRIQQGDVISDRTEQRQQLEARKKQLEVAIAQMSLPLNPIASLPAPNLDSEQVALKKATFQLEQATKALNEYPGIQFKDPWLREVFEPEKIKELASLKQRQLEASIAVEAALARLSEAKTRYQQEQYQHSIQLAAQQTNLQKQQYDLASLASQLQEVEEKLGELVAVRSPYAGRVRRVKVLGQNERLIQVEVTLDIRQKGSNKNPFN
jgi:multidrug efflux pump subunit AcrA (membrane-fusion protein)